MVLWKAPASGSLLIQSQACRARGACASLLSPASSEHVEFLLLQRRRKLAPGGRGAKPAAAAEGAPSRWGRQVPPAHLLFLPVPPWPWYVKTVGTPSVEAMNESPPKYLDRKPEPWGGAGPR